MVTIMFTEKTSDNQSAEDRIRLQEQANRLYDIVVSRRTGYSMRDFMAALNRLEDFEKKHKVTAK